MSRLKFLSVLSLALIHGSFSTATYDYCITKECVLSSAYLIQNMNQSADPCTNFFEYACGGWVKQNPIPENKTLWEQFFIDIEMVTSTLETMLLDETELYQSCKSGINQLEISQGYQIKCETKVCDRIGDIEYENDIDEDGNYSLILELVGSTFNHSMLNVSTREKLQAMFQLLAHKPLSQDQLKDVEKLDKFIHDMVNITNEQILINESYNLSNLDHVQKELFSFLDWQTYLTSAMPDDMENYVTDTMRVGFYGPKISKMKSVNDLVLNVSSSDCKTVHNYIWFSALYKLLAEKQLALKWTMEIEYTFGLDRILTELFHPELKGQTEDQSLNAYCMEVVTKKYLWVALGALFVQEVYGKQAKPALEQIIQNIKGKTIDILQNAHWLDDKTKALAIEKADAMKFYAAYPDIMSVHNFHLLQQYYIDVANVKSYYGVTKAVAQKKFRESCKLLFDPNSAKQDVWRIGITVYNALYFPQYNAFYIPAAYAMPPQFWWNGPRSLNYACIGYTIGHEITHGFDNRGRMYDKVGNQNNWWTNESAKQFNNKAACFANQYSDLPTGIVNGTLNGNRTLGELIADAGGIKSAYLAYRALIAKEGSEEPGLPGLMHLSHDQIFFLAAAQSYCGAFTDKPYNLMSSHPVTKFRAAMLMLNSGYFHKAFQCEKGTPMNPPVQCEVWL